MDYRNDPLYNYDPHKLFQPKLSQKALERACVVNLKFGPMRG